LRLSLHFLIIYSNLDYLSSKRKVKTASSSSPRISFSTFYSESFTSTTELNRASCPKVQEHRKTGKCTLTGRLPNDRGKDSCWTAALWLLARLVSTADFLVTLEDDDTVSFFYELVLLFGPIFCSYHNWNGSKVTGNVR
jgi:hypothetical protein